MAVKKTTYTLEVQDSFSAVLGQFKSQLNGIQNETASLRNALGGMGGQLDALGVSWRSLFGILAGGGFAAMLKGSIDSEAGLLRLSRATGMTVESLSSFMPVAKDSGTAMDEVAKASERLSKAMVASENPHSKQAAAFKALGLSALDAAGKLKTPQEMMLEVAKGLDLFQDGAGKTALMMDLLGKSGATMLPFLTELADKGAANVLVTADQARAAKQFDDNLNALTMRISGFAREMANGLLPALNDIGRAIGDANAKRGDYISFWEKTGEVVRFFAIALEGGWLAIQNIGSAFATLGRAMVAFDSLDFKGMQKAFADGDKEIEKNDAAYSDFVKTVLDGSKFFTESGDAFKKAEETKRQALNYTGIAHADSMKAFATEKAALQEKLALVTSGSQIDAYRFKLEKDNYKLLTTAQRDYLVSQYALIEAKKLDFDLQKKINAGELAFAANYEKNRLAVGQYINTLVDQNAVAKIHLEMLGHTREELEKALLDYALKKKLLGDVTDGERALIEAQIADKESTIDLTKAKSDQLSVWDELATRGSKIFSEMATSGKNAFDILKTELRSFANELIALFARKWILQLGATLLGGTGAGDALASQALSSGSNSLAGTVVSGVGSYIGRTYPGLASYFGGGATPASINASEAASGLPGSGGGGSSMLGTAGWIAVIVAAMYANNQMYTAGWRAGNQTSREFLPMGPGGFNSVVDRSLQGIGFSGRFASLVSGSSMSSRIFGMGATHADAAGVSGSFGPGGFTGTNWQDMSQRGGVFRHDNRWQDPSALTRDQTTFFSDLTTGIHDVVGTLAASLGVDAAHATAGIARRDFNLQMTDNGKPKTDAEIAAMFGDLLGKILQDQVAAVLTAGGQNDFGAFIAGLQGTGQEITKVVDSLLGFMDAVSTKAFDLRSIIADNTKSPQSQFDDHGEALLKLASTSTMTSASLDTLTAATLNYRAAAVQLIQSLEQAKQQIGDMFGGTERTIRTATMGRQDLYNFYQTDAASAQAQAMASTDAGTITRLMTQVNQDIQAAWGLFTPAEQVQHQQEFLTNLGATNTQMQAHLTALQERVVADTRATLDRIDAIMTRVAHDMQTAANTALAAARTPINLNLNLTGGGAGSVVVG